MGVFTLIGGALGYPLVAASAGGLTAFGAGAAATAIVGGAAGYTAYSAQQQSKALKSAMPQPIKAETIISEARQTAQDTTLAKKKAIARSKSIFTSPMGVEEEATLAKKTLLGR